MREPSSKSDRAHRPRTARYLPSIRRADRRTLQDRIYEQLKAAVIAGTLRPGERVSIRSLAYLLGTSPIPVREALRRLVAERALTVLANGSVAVPAMTRSRFEDLRRTRIAIEGYATELAAETIGDLELKLLNALYRQIESARNKKDMRALLAANQHLRFTIYRATRSEILMPIIESLWLQVGPFFNLVAESAMLTKGLRYDKAAIAALRRRDGASARRWIERDIGETGDYIMSLLSKV